MLYVIDMDFYRLRLMTLSLIRHAMGYPASPTEHIRSCDRLI